MKLDNAAKLFPAISSSELTSVFRITVGLDRPVRYSCLMEAIDITVERFPYYRVVLGSGIFWHYLEYTDRNPELLPEEEIPCKAFLIRQKKTLLYRILARSDRISVEFLHILTDGSGALEFLKTLLLVYLRKTGCNITATDGIILPESPVNPEEIEDGYKRFFRKVPSPAKKKAAWHLPFRLNSKPRLRITRAELAVDQLLAASRKDEVSITEYLAAVYLYSLHNIFLAQNRHAKRKPTILRIEVPVNLRKRFPLATMRNFSLFVMPEIDLSLGNYSFKEILSVVHHGLQSGSDPKQISRFLSSNVSYEKNILVRLLPLFVKEMAISAIYRNIGSKQCSGIITNLGAVTLPPEFSEFVKSFEIIPPPPNKTVKASCGVVSYNNKLIICFANITESKELEKHFFSYLTRNGINVKLLLNK